MEFYPSAKKKKNLGNRKKVNSRILWTEMVINANEEKQHRVLEVKGQKGYLLMLI